MALYIPHSIFHLAQLLYVRPETFGPYYVPSYVWEKRVNFSESFNITLKDEEKRKRKMQSKSLYWDIQAVGQYGFVSSHFELMTRFAGLYCSQRAATYLTRDSICQVSNTVFICHGPHHIKHSLGRIVIFFIVVHLLTYLLTAWSRVLLEKLTGCQLVKKYPAFYGARRSIQSLPSRIPIPLSEDPSWYYPLIHTWDRLGM